MLLPWLAQAHTLHGRVVAISDGDTITVLDEQQRQHKVRLAGIDAPEKAQPFGTRSRQYLSAMIFQRRVEVEWRGRDRYGRIVGKVLVGQRDADLSQIAAGLAWHYKRYRDEQSAVDRESYSAAEAAARSERLGLWADPDPVAPWDWRRNKKETAEQRGPRQ